MKIIAHRGASGLAPENTLKAVDQALKSEACAIEVDVYRSGDRLMVIHDRWLHRRTNGTGQITRTSLQQLEALDAGEGEKIPSLRQVLERVAGRCDINVELKGDDTLELAHQVIDYACEHYGFSTDQFLLSSFNHHLLAQSRQLRPDLKLGALTACLPVDLAAFAQQLGAYSINCDVDFTNQALVEDAHQRGLKVFVYTVDEEEDIEMLSQWKVDGIFSNFPCRARAKTGSKVSAAKQVWAD
ncbi:glycerophosphodiester phosphodiesterase [Paraferrimonas sedimenticola]|uniref:Glycerophosphoryl diester phosphodiesterase n=1 Tax=Paraferrimonas sedimenticola TaxID=375674 RepID=A0AA37RV18_9GAMM|nr:glycerophosphodiester phosphodiesterase family protein [Paraferrimonas sedimenticola]GLP95753.1 glycerophosphoryl diester phosphodiesterase [Paraferrimonas sedimenticola]